MSTYCNRSPLRRHICGVLCTTLLAVALGCSKSAKTASAPRPGDFPTASSDRRDHATRNGHTTAARPPEARPGDGHARQKFSKIEIHYGTDREQLGPRGAIQQFGDASVSLSLGVCYVSIPHRHKPGCLETPRWWLLEHPDPEDHVMLLEAFKLSEDAFIQSIKSAVERSTNKDVFLFIHGYNNSFEDAARRTAQVTYDLGFKGAVAMFAWAAKGGMDHYLVDHETATLESCNHLATFLKLLSDRFPDSKIHILAHSMGNLVLCRAIEELDRQSRAEPRFGHIVMAAPDVPARVFIGRYAEPLKRHAGSVTVYASSVDLALTISSQWLRRGDPRLGATKPTVTIVEGIDTVVADDFAKGLLNHAYYAEIQSIIHDLVAAIRLGYNPERRCLESVLDGSGRYWRCVRKPNEDCRTILMQAIAAAMGDR